MDQDRLATALGYVFREPAHLQRALTHRSYSAANNERLEFLGDALISAVIAERLFRDLLRAEEGALSRLRASLVRESTLARIARRLELGERLQLGEGELKSGGWRRDSVLADAFEAVIGAVFLDGGFEVARDVCLRQFEPDLASLPDAESLKDAKTRLQEWLQGRGRPLPAYDVLSESGPPHRRNFHVCAKLLDAERMTEAHASSRRVAEQKAAELLLQALIAEQEK